MFGSQAAGEKLRYGSQAAGYKEAECRDRETAEEKSKNPRMPEKH